MISSKSYRAPWGKALRWSSAGLVALAAAFAFLLPLLPGEPASLTLWALPLILICCLCFTIRGYTVSGDSLLIRRLLWTTRLDLDGLMNAEARPHAMKGSLRTFGNGGAFSFTGWYWSKELGAYRAFVTDLHRTVVLRFGKRIVVVSPDAPEDFAAELNRP